MELIIIAVNCRKRNISFFEIKGEAPAFTYTKEEIKGVIAKAGTPFSIERVSI